MFIAIMVALIDEDTEWSNDIPKDGLSYFDVALPKAHLAFLLSPKGRQSALL